MNNKKYLADYDIYHSGYQENDFNIEWMRYGSKCKLPDIVKNYRMLRLKLMIFMRL